jgi:D-cysteine desulfhydrase
MTLIHPRRVELARVPTPLQPLERAGSALGVELWIKRDDMTGIELSGNKVRKLEYLLAEAHDQRADTVITCGGEQSNHCRATALAAVKMGMRSILLLRTDDPAAPPPLAGNTLLDRLAGAEIVWISRADWARRNELMRGQAERVRAAGGTPYVITEGGSSATGAWGYIRCAEELARELDELPTRPTTIVYACGSGGTGAGLILGARACGFDGLQVQVAGVNVCDDRDYFLRVIGDICGQARDRWPALAPITADDIDIVDGYVGRGYAQSRPAELERLRDLARSEGVILDPVYTGKAWYALTEELRRDPKRFGDRVVFLHTGGLFGLMPRAAELTPILA